MLGQGDTVEMRRRRRRVALGIHAIGWTALSGAALLVRVGLGALWAVPGMVCFLVASAYSLDRLMQGLDAGGTPTVGTIRTHHGRGAGPPGDDERDGTDRVWTWGLDDLDRVAGGARSSAAGRRALHRVTHTRHDWSSGGGLAA